MRVWERVDAEFLSRRGLAVPPDYIDAVGAMGFLETAEYTITRFSLTDTPEALMDEWREMAWGEYASKVRLKPGAGEFIARLRGIGVKTGIATSSTLALCLAALRGNGVEGMFDAVCSVDEVGFGKDFPDIFMYAAGKLGIPPEKCLAFEDNVRAAKSAKLAGMAVCGVYDESSASRWGEMNLVADAVIADFREAWECFFRAP
jgi:HAD superfamily hydrolase (TIGR01509 family)